MKSLHLATPDDLPKLIPMVSAFHVEQQYETDEDHVVAALMPLLDGSPYGAIWLIGPRRSPVGYLAVTFGWSIEFGGLDAILDELYIRPAVRGRGMGGEAIDGIAKDMIATAKGHIVDEHGDGWLPGEDEVGSTTDMLDQLRELAVRSVNSLLARSLDDNLQRELGDYLTVAMESNRSGPETRP